MRRIPIYRGKRIDNAEWVEGQILCVATKVYGLKTYIIPQDEMCTWLKKSLTFVQEVVPETVGRRIDWPCYNNASTEQLFNQQLFEGDIIEVYRSKLDNIDLVKPDRIAIILDESCIIVNGGGYCFPQDTTQVKVIGNVHDNPELVGVKYANLFKYYNCLKG